MNLILLIATLLTCSYQTDAYSTTAASARSDTFRRLTSARLHEALVGIRNEPKRWRNLLKRLSDADQAAVHQLDNAAALDDRLRTDAGLHRRLFDAIWDCFTATYHTATNVVRNLLWGGGPDPHRLQDDLLQVLNKYLLLEPLQAALDLNGDHFAADLLEGLTRSTRLRQELHRALESFRKETTLSAIQDRTELDEDLSQAIMTFLSRTHQDRVLGVRSSDTQLFEILCAIVDDKKKVVVGFLGRDFRTKVAPVLRRDTALRSDLRQIMRWRAALTALFDDCLAHIQNLMHGDTSYYD